MQIRRIYLKNLNSIRDEVEIDFTAAPLAESGLFAITGDTGAGKTTILDAITLAMYGEICRSSEAKEALSYGAEEGWAGCEFEAKNRRFLAKWSIRKRKSKKENNFSVERTVGEWDVEKGEFITVAERKVTEVNHFIKEVTGLDFSRFTRSVLLAQGEFAAFLKAKPDERSELLERITRTEIYSELSKAALERFNHEKKKLEELRSQQASLKVFSKEELKERKALLKEKEKQYREIRNALDEANRALRWLLDVEKTKEQKAAAETESSNLAIEKAAKAAEFDRLALHRKAAPHYPTLQRFDEKVLEASYIGQEIISLETGIAILQKEASQAKDAYEKLNDEFKKLKTSQPETLRLLEEVMTLDQQIQSRENAWTKQKDELSDWQDKKHTALSRVAVLEQSAEELKTTIDDLNRWLSEHAGFETLSQDLKPIQLLREQLRENLRKQKSLNEEVASLTKHLQTERKEEETLNSRLKQEQTTLETLNNEFNKEAPDSYIPSRQDLLEKLTREIDILGDQHKNFQLFNGLSEEYSKTLEEVAQLEILLDNLRREELDLDKQLLTVIEQGEEWEQQRRFKQEIYQQQLKFANYEKDRAELQEGEPCPLCQSTHHPFREHGVTPYPDEAKKELDATELECERQKRRRDFLLKKHTDIATQIQQIDSISNGQLGRLQTRIIGYERKIAALFPDLEIEDFSRSHGEWLTKKVMSFKENLTQKKEIRERLQKYNRQMEFLEESIRQLSGQLKDWQFAVQQLINSLEDRQRSLDEMALSFQQTQGELNNLVGKYGYQFSMEGANGMFTELESKERDFSLKSEARTQHLQQLELTRQELRQTRLTLDDVSSTCERLLLEIAGEENQLNELKTKRSSLFGTKNPQQEREILLARIDAEEQALELARTVFEQKNVALSLQQQTLKDLHIRWESAKKSMEEARKNLISGWTMAGFEDVESFRNAFLPETEVKRIEEQAEAFTQRETALTQQLNTLTAQLTAALQNPLTTQSQEFLQSEIDERDAASQEILQSIGAIQQQLKDNELQEREAATLLELMANQRDIYNRWAAINDLIGAYDGKKFRIFAQGLTLQKLVNLANKHLAHLHGRYLILKRPGDDLELDIKDTYQADNVRSMNTLSGGESFLVSLALALGLSDLAGHNANIRSLFIDEGFGTLDEQALDLAIGTLENLQAKGKTIGIISHVKELKERIATQIRVVKKGGGMSTVEILG